MPALQTGVRIPHIVLADDNPDECLTFLDALENLPIQHIFSLAENGAMLLNMLDEDEFIPDLIFIDLNMKGISGKDCLKAIRMSHKFDAVPVIAYSSAVDYEDIAECYQAKANLYVVKSSYVPTLSNVLNAVLEIPADKLLTIPKEEFLKKIALA